MRDSVDVIIGGGPVGFYLAYQLLVHDPSRRVKLYESRTLNRPQVIRIPFAIAVDLPQSVKNEMWRDAQTRSRIFDPVDAADPLFWPKPNYFYWPFISIGAFQNSLLQFLSNNSQTKERFEFISDNRELNSNSWLKSARAVYCTCGYYAKTFRKRLNVLKGKIPEMKGHGIYLIYQNEKFESYRRSDQAILSQELGEQGLTYAASNNINRDVQLYTYPEGELASIFSSIPDEFIERARYRENLDALTWTGSGNFSQETSHWFDSYKSTVLNVANKFGIEFPNDQNQIRVFYAERSEYYWNVVATRDQSVPVFFLGDSAGSTDYKSGLSMGRGLLSVQVLHQLKLEYPDNLQKIASEFQEYWNTILQREFDRGVQLVSEPWIQYQYLIRGHEVMFPNHERIHYLTDAQYPEYLERL